MSVCMYDPEIKSMEENTEGYTIIPGVWRWRERKRGRGRRQKENKRGRTVLRVSQHGRYDPTYVKLYKCMHRKIADLKECLFFKK